MKLFKKVCGILCVGFVLFTMNSVSAADYTEIDVEFPKNAVIKNGEISLEVNAYKYIDYIPGDVDKSGIVTLNDAQCVLQTTLNIPCTSGVDSETEDFKKIADVNGDSSVTSEDAQIILEIALRIKDNYSVERFGTKIETSDIKSLKYMIINGDSELYTSFKEYSSMLSDLKTSYDANNGSYDSELLNEFLTEEAKIKALVKKSELLSPDKKTITGFIGNKQVDELYVITYLTLEDGTEHFDIVSYTDFGFSESEWKAHVEAYNKNHSSDSSTVAEETVKNPETVVAISVIGLAIIAVACTLVAKKKNLFSRV